jgi:hypothetical protein
MGRRGIAAQFLTSELDGDEWSDSLPYPLPPGTYWIGGWVGPRVSLDALE